MSSEAIEIQSRADGQFVAATLLSGMAATDLLVVENEWHQERSLIMQELLAAGAPRAEWPQSLHWDWSKKAPMLQLLASSGFGIVCESRWQGVMLTQVSPLHVARLGSDKGKQLVYVDFIEIAPWNWPVPKVGRAGRFRGVGSAMLWKAVKQSEDEGLHGRVGLHALRQSESFYEKACGMTAVARDANKQDLLYFELTRDDAQRLMQKGGQT